MASGPVLTVAPSLVKQEREFRMAVKAVAGENVVLAARIRGSLAVSTAQSILDGILESHEILRTTLAEQNGEIVQHIHARPGVDAQVVDLEERRSSRATAKALLEGLGEPFVLSMRPIVRPVVLRLGPCDTVLAMVLPHSVSDGGCRAAFHSEVITRYEAHAVGKRSGELQRQVRNLAAWDRWADHSAAHRHWRGELNGVPRSAACPLTDDNIAPGQYVEEAVAAPPLSAHAANQLTRIADIYAVPPAMLGLAALATLLYARTRRECLVVGLFLPQPPKQYIKVPAGVVG
jgi:hypothetical protein